MRELWIVGKVTNYKAGAWRFIGVLDEKALALLACRDKWYFIAPIRLSEVLPNETVDRVNAYYPKRRKP